MELVEITEDEDANSMKEDEERKLWKGTDQGTVRKYFKVLQYPLENS